MHCFFRKANAYICNLQEHWFVLKKFHKQWFILNSVLEGPKEITESYLELYLKQLENEGIKSNVNDWKKSMFLRLCNFSCRWFIAN